MFIPLPSLRYHSEAQLFFMPRCLSDSIISNDLGPSSKASVKIEYQKGYQVAAEMPRQTIGRIPHDL